MNRGARRAARKRKRTELDRLRRAAQGGRLDAAGNRSAGDALARAGRLKDAAACYRRALAQDPDDAFTLGNLAFVLAGMDDVKGAVDGYRRALELAPGNAAMITNLGVVLKRAGMAERAAMRFEQALEIVPDDADTHYHLADTLASLDRRDDAIAHYRRALANYGATLAGRPRDATLLAKIARALLRTGRAEDALAFYRRAVEADPGHADAHFQMGLACAKLDDLEGAAACYRRAVALEPDNVTAHKLLADALAELGRPAPAARSYRKVLRRFPDHVATRHFLASVSPGPTPDAPPERYVEDLFDNYADRFDAHLVEHLEYRAPEHLRAAVGRLADAPGRAWTVFDLGCGTGLCGALFRDLAARLVGVDLSHGMLEKARARGVYDELRLADITAALDAEDAAIDLAIAADVFIYVGNLTAVFTACAGALRPGGRFAFTTEAAAGTSFVLEVSGRFAHAPAYVEALAAAHGFDVEQRDEITIRLQRRQPVRGHLFILRLRR